MAVLDEVATRAAIAFANARSCTRACRTRSPSGARAEAQLQEANRRKDEFLAMLSHELRNPLAPIRNAVEVIRRLAPHDAKLTWATDITDRQVRQLTRLVDELLDVARISQGKIVLQSAPLDLTARGGAVRRDSAAPVHRAHAASTLTQAMPRRAGVAARRLRAAAAGDRQPAHNAAKYTPEGGSDRAVATCRRAGRRRCVTVRDNGIGIEPELLPRVFDLFEQGQRALDRSQGGLGVGLTLVQRLVELHDGRVEAHSAGAGQGAEFRVYLPCLQAPAARDGHAAGRDRRCAAGVPAHAGRRRQPRRRRHHRRPCWRSAATRCAARATARRRSTKRRASHPKWCCSTSACRSSTATRWRAACASCRRRATRLIIGLTGYGMPADRQRGREAGFDHHLLKPADPAELHQLIESWSPHASAEHAETKASNLYAFKRP